MASQASESGSKPLSASTLRSIPEDSASLPDPDVIAREIVEDLEAALEQFAAIADDLER